MLQNDKRCEADEHRIKPPQTSFANAIKQSCYTSRYIIFVQYMILFNRAFFPVALSAFTHRKLENKLLSHENNGGRWGMVIIITRDDADANVSFIKSHKRK